MPKTANPKRITLSEIARICGVSRQVVSLVVAGKKHSSIRYSTETRDRVLAVVKETGYRPNRTVRGFFSKRHGTIGLLGHSPYSIPADALATLMETAQRHDQMVCIEQLVDGRLPRLVAEDCVDGLILFETVDQTLMAEIDRFRLPVIQINTNQRFGPGCVTFDEEGAVKVAAERLAARGCRRPGVLQNAVHRWQDHFSGWVRRDEFCRQARRLGLAEPALGEAIPVYEDDYTVEPALAFLRANPQLDCVLAEQDGLVPPLYEAAQALGRRVPDDLAVISWNNGHVGKTVRPGLTTFDIDNKHLGRLAGTLLNDLFSGRTPPSGLRLPFRLIERESG